MMRAHMDGRSAIPWWAAFGAPLLGVPLLVGLLALGAARGTPQASGFEPEPPAATRTIEAGAAALERTVELPCSSGVGADLHS